MGAVITLTVGLPRSGKSTWAREQGVPVVNGDSVRLALHGRRFLAQAEPMVHAITQIMAEALVLAGHEAIIIDDCNVSNVRRQRWYDLAKRVGATVHFRVFSTDPDECKRRATATGQEDLLPVIDRMARDWDFCSVDWKYDG